MKRQRPTDRERMNAIMARIPDLTLLASDARELLGKTQNGPPGGEADGTLHPDAWYVLRAVCTALDALALQAPAQGPKL